MSTATTTSSASRFARKPGQVVPFKDRFSYTFAEIGSQFTWAFVGSYLVVFYTDVAMLAPTTVALIMLIARIWDAFDDPFLGYLTERTKSRWGRFRPYVAFGAPMLAVSLVLAFLAPDFGGNNTAKAIYAGVTYIVLGIAYSLVNMTYGALAGVMSKDYDERIILNWYRGVGGQLGSLIIGAIAMPILIFFSGAGDSKTVNATGYLWTAVALAVASIPLFLITFFNSREVIRPEISHVRVPLATTVKNVLGNRNLLIISGALLLMLTGLFGRLGVIIFYVRDLMGDPILMSVVMPTFGMAGTIGTILMPRLATKVGKKPMIIASMLVAAVCLFGIYLTPPTNVTMILVLTAIYGFSGFAGPVSLSMVPDTVDYQEWKTGVRSDGTAYAFTSLATKVASALGGSLGILIIGSFGYQPGQTPTPEVQTGINVAVNLVPALLAVAGAVLLFFYNLTPETVHKVREELDAREAAEARDNLSSTEQTMEADPDVAFVEAEERGITGEDLGPDGAPKQ